MTEEQRPLQNLLGKAAQYGGTVGSGSMEICPNRPDFVRSRLLIQNVGATGNLWLSFSPFATVGQCLCLQPGQSFVLEAGDNYSGEISGITDTAASFAVTEFLQ